MAASPHEAGPPGKPGVLSISCLIDPHVVIKSTEFGDKLLFGVNSKHFFIRDLRIWIIYLIAL